ncbi:MAG: sigma-70 family RNA polymerase sigma factor [Cyclobacteriaceae bacterium]
MSNSPMTEDEAIISRIIKGDMESFGQLIKRHERLVGHMISRLVKIKEDQEELCQDVFLKVHEKLGDFHFQSRLSTWIATIAYRHAINHLRKKRIPMSDLDEDKEFKERFVDQGDLEEDLADRDIEEKVKKYIDQLPAHYSTVLTLYHVDGMSYSEIGKITGMPEGTVKNYLFRARNLLKEKVLKHLGKEEIR